jgi:hypothetical protein
MPPIHESPSTAVTAGLQRSSESDEDSEERRLRSPRKRRRMGIDEVLQKWIEGSVYLGWKWTLTWMGAKKGKEEQQL